MTIFERQKQLETKIKQLEMEFLFSLKGDFDDVGDLNKAKKTLEGLSNKLDNRANLIKEASNNSSAIWYLSNMNIKEVKNILINVILDTYGKCYKYKEITVDKNETLGVLVDAETDIDNNVTKQKLEERKTDDVIVLFEKEKGVYQHLYTKSSPEDLYATCPIEESSLNPCAVALQDFIEFGISSRANYNNLTWETLYKIYTSNITHGYDEELLDTADFEDAYAEHERISYRYQKRRKEAYFNKQKRLSINKVQAERKLEKIPKKYNLK